MINASWTFSLSPLVFLIILRIVGVVYVRVGDDEDMDADELLEAIKLHRLKKKEDPENN